MCIPYSSCRIRTSCFVSCAVSSCWLRRRMCVVRFVATAIGTQSPDLLLALSPYICIYTASSAPAALPSLSSLTSSSIRSIPYYVLFHSRSVYLLFFIVSQIRVVYSIAQERARTMEASPQIPRGEEECLKFPAIFLRRIEAEITGKVTYCGQGCEFFKF